MDFIDISELILTTKNANLKGKSADGYHNAPLVLFGRIGEPLEQMPYMITRAKNLRLAADTQAFFLDLFAIQFCPSREADCFTCNGRAVVICSATQKPNSIVALKGNIHLNLRPLDDKGAPVALSTEANLPLVCVYHKNSDSNFDIYPATEASYSEISVPDKEYFQRNLFYPSKIKQEHISANELGAMCPLCQLSDIPVPSIYIRNPNGLVSRNACIAQDSPVAGKIRERVLPERNFWACSRDLQRAMGIIPEDMNIKRSADLLAYSEGNSQEYPIILELYDKLADSNKKISAHLKEILSEPSDNFPEQLNGYLDNISKAITANWYNNQFGIKANQTSKEFLEAVIQNMCDNAEIKNNICYTDIIPQDVLLQTLTGKCECKDKLLQELSSALPAKLSNCFLLSILNTALNLRFAYKNLFNKAISETKILELVFTNPYSLTFINPSISINSLDKLACFTDNAEELSDLRILAAVHNQMLNLQNKGIVIKRSAFYPRLDYNITSAVAVTFDDNHSILSQKAINLSRQFISQSNNCRIPVQAVLSDNSVKISGLNTAKILQVYLDSGFGISLNSDYAEYLIDYVPADEFCYIYNRLLPDEDFSFAEVSYNQLRAEYESKHNIKLTELQYKSAFLLNANASCLTGNAGSGKTTALDWILFIAERVYGYSEEDISLLAPSGMAAQRLASCTGKKAGTIHSKLRLMTEEYLWSYELKPDENYRPELVIIDESTMISLGLLYNALKKIPEGVKIIFCGDIEQLPAVETGKPFVDLINFLPYVRLSESKRVTSDSGIAQNCSRLINTSSELLQSAQDFKLVRTDPMNIGNAITGIVKYHLGLSDICPCTAPIETQRLFDKNDIQVISPVTKEKYLWGTACLNPELQNIFNPKTTQASIQYYNNSRLCEYRVGDRILNKLNQNSCDGYIWEDDTHKNLIRIDANLCNGSIGYIKAIQPADELSYFKYDSEENLIADTTMNTCSQTTKSGKSKIVMLVEYTAYDKSSFLVPYFAYQNSQAGTVYDCTLSGDFDYIELAYALTVHKMQGSQAKLIIAPIFALNIFKNTLPFINKNMVYTMLSRAQTGLYLIGNIEQNNNSPLMIARHSEAFSDRKSLIDIALRKF